MSKELDKLIEGILNERGIDLPYDIGAKNWTRTSQRNVADVSGYSPTNSKKSKNYNLFQKLLALAKLDKDEKKIEVDDLQNYLNANEDPEVILKQLAADIRPENLEDTIVNLRNAFQQVENDLLDQEALKKLFSSKERKEIDRGLRALKSTNDSLKTKALEVFSNLARKSKVEVKELFKTLSTATIDAVDP